MRVGERAIPVVWTVKKTSGGIGFDVSKPLLDATHAMMPKGAEILFAGALLGGIDRHAANDHPRHPEKTARSLTSFFKRGIRILLNAAIALASILPLWHYAKRVGW